jgi:hypothetical protein
MLLGACPSKALYIGVTGDMELKLAQEIIACLPQGRSLFHYGRYGYAPLLLSYLLDGEVRISELRKSRYGKLLQTPLLKRVIADSGKALLEQSQLDTAYWRNTIPFVLTLDLFDGHMQTSRRGINLVLQLNFNTQHDSEYVRLAKPGNHTVMRCSGHPVLQPGKRELFRETLAWSRIDLDFTSNQALIEEIQSDWVRSAAYVKGWIVHCRKSKRELPAWFELRGALDEIEYYINQILDPYLNLWQEAMLSATIDFIYRELGIETLYYHSHETGGVVKRIEYGQAPRSLYSQLPRKFCFNRTPSAPDFLQSDKRFRRRIKKATHPYWYKLVIPNQA